MLCEILSIWIVLLCLGCGISQIIVELINYIDISSIVFFKHSMIKSTNFQWNNKLMCFYMIMKHFLFSSLAIMPQGSQFLYSTFGYTLLAAIVERASGYKYLDYMQKIFHDLDMLTTVQEENEPVIYNRAR